jgi:hypothetical protein
MPAGREALSAPTNGRAKCRAVRAAGVQDPGAILRASRQFFAELDLGQLAIVKSSEANRCTLRVMA